MSALLESGAIDEAVHMLADFLQLPPGEVHSRVPADPRGADAVVDAGAFSFVLEWKSSGSAALVSGAIQKVRRYAAEADGDVVPLVVVPYMGEVGRALCEEAGVAWMDLSGNAKIFAPGLRILVDGQTNRFKQRGRPSSAFAPKSSRIARWLLMHPAQAMNQRHVARATDMDEGFTSRIVAKLVDDGLVVRDADGAIRPRDPDLLLDAWSEDYDFSKHEILCSALEVGDQWLTGPSKPLATRVRRSRTKREFKVGKQSFGKMLRHPLCGELAHSKLTGKHHRRNNPDFPLRRFVRCALCDSPTTGGWSRSHIGKRYGYYQCRTCGKASTRKEVLEAAFLELLDRLRPKPEYLEALRESVLEVWRERKRALEEARPILERRLARVQEQKKRLMEAYVYEQAIDEATYRREPLRLDQEITVAKVETYDNEIDDLDVETVLEFVEHVVVNARERVQPEATPQAPEGPFPRGSRLQPVCSSET